MIDIHTHILPKVDDGASSMKEAICMARMAVESGTDGLVTTPHGNIYKGQDTAKFEIVYQQFKEMLEQESIALRLYRGMEIYVTDDIFRGLEEGILWPIHNTDYLLIEFGFEEQAWYISDIIHKLKEQGYKPIIAHPERYSIVQSDPKLVREWLSIGCGIQVNKGSILGQHGNEVQKAVLYLLEHRLAQVVASDTHASEGRTPYLDRVNRYITNQISSRYAQLLLDENPRRVIENRRLVYHDVSE